MARHSAPVLLTVNERIKEPGFERIDAQYRWAGLARLNFRQLMDTVHTLDLLADWDLQSTLLRHAVQAGAGRLPVEDEALRSEEHTSELQSLMRISFAGFCLKKKKT